MAVPSPKSRGLLALFLVLAVIALAYIGLTRRGAETRQGAAGAVASNWVAPSGDPIHDAENNPNDWPSYGRTYSEQRYSALDQINRGNVGQLKLAWYQDLDTNRGQEATPLVINGVMFVTTNWSKVRAIDAATGRLLWAYDPKVPGEVGVRGCCDTVNRGAAYYQGKVFVATFDARLVALDAKTGAVAWVRNTIPKDAWLGDVRSYTSTGAPRVTKGGVVMIGNGGAELGVRGFVSGFEAATGKLRWRFFTTPNIGNKPDRAASDKALHDLAYPTWAPNSGWTKSGGGGTAWDSIVYDPITDLVYIGVGNGSVWNYKQRSDGVGDNLFLGSIVAIRPETGEYVWHFQETPKDQWDYTSTQQIMTADLPIDGKMRHVILHAPKNGIFYVIDAATGKFLSGTPYTQLNWLKSLDPKTGRPEFVPDALYSLTGKTWLGIPGNPGGHNWQAMAFSPKTRLVYIPAQQIPTAYASSAHMDLNERGINVGNDAEKMIGPTDPKILAEVTKSVTGWLLAWDPVARKARFKVEHKGPANGGLLATGGDLLFQGLADGTFHAFDANDGKDLFVFDAKTGIVAPPITYAVGGKQYVAIEVGWGGIFPLMFGELSKKSGAITNHSRILVFALDGKARLPATNTVGFLPKAPPKTFDAAQVAAGHKNYANFCMACHGDNVVSGGVLPDLRWSGSLRTREGFYNVVGRGSLTPYGMVAFKSVLTSGDIDTIRQYLISRAQETYPTEEAKAKARLAKAPGARP